MKHRMQKFIAPLLIHTLGLLPLPINHAIGYLIGRLGNLFDNELRRVARINIGIYFPELSPRAQKQLVKKHLIEIGKTFSETACLWSWSRKKLISKIKAVHNLELIDETLKEGKGIILALPHLGCWEAFGLYLSCHYPLTCMVRPHAIPSVNNIMVNARERFGLKTVPTDVRGVKGLNRALKNGEMIWIMADQVPAAGHGIFADFFGKSVMTATLAARLYTKTHSHVITGYAKRLPWGRGYEIIIHDATPAADNDDLLATTNSINHALEKCAKEVPPQYQLSYRRYKALPEGESNIYVKHR